MSHHSIVTSRHMINLSFYQLITGYVSSFLSRITKENTKGPQYWFCILALCERNPSVTRGFPSPVTAGFPSLRASDAEASYISNLPDWCILRTEDNQSGTGFSSIEIWHYFITTELARYESVLCVNQSNEQNAWGLISLNTPYCMKSALMDFIIYFGQIAWWHECVLMKTGYAAYFIMKIYYHRYLIFTTRNVSSYNWGNSFWTHVFYLL